MKKLNYLLLGLAGLTLASCSQDDILNGGDGNYQVRINLPADMATRASIGDFATAAQTLNYAIFDMEGNYLDKGTANFGGGTSLTLPLYLASGSSFQIAFFAQSPNSTDVYSFNASETTHSVTVNYEKMQSGYNDADDYDCFYNLLETGVIGSNEMKTEVTLNRIVAQINWGTNDFVNATVKNTFGEDLVDLQATLTTTAYETFDLLTKEVSDENDKVTIGEFTPTNTGSMSYPVGGYEYVAMQYVLVPAEKTIHTLNLDVTNGAAANTTITVDNAPLQANYRTNIYGNLLTDNIEFQVDLSADWGGADYQVVESSSAFADALKAGGNVVLNSDIQLPSTDVLYVTNDVVLDLNGHTIYSNVAKDGSITVNGGNLTIKGNGSFIDNNPKDVYQTLIGVNKGTLTIEGGDFTGYGEGQVIYVQEGTVNINGGTFALLDDNTKDNWCINCKDGTFNSTSFVNVKGGMFYDWNPASTSAEGKPNVSYLASGYQSVATTIDGATWYVVVPEGTNNKVVSNSSDLASAIAANDGATIYLTPGTYSTPKEFEGDVTIKGLDPENTVLKANMGYWTANNAVINLSDLTVESYYNSTNHTSMAFNGAVEQTFNNVTFVGEFHAQSGTVNLEDCTFIYNKPSGTNYALWCEANTTVNISNCTMNCGNGKAILVFAGEGAPSNSVGGNITINGLTVTNTGTTNDKAVVEIHSEKYVSAGTIILNDITYPSGVFGGGLWQEIYNVKDSPLYGQETTYYKVIVNGQIVQEGGAKGTYLGDGKYSDN